MSFTPLKPTVQIDNIETSGGIKKTPCRTLGLSRIVRPSPLASSGKTGKDTPYKSPIIFPLTSNNTTNKDITEDITGKINRKKEHEEAEVHCKNVISDDLLQSNKFTGKVKKDERKIVGKKSVKRRLMSKYQTIEKKSNATTNSSLTDDDECFELSEELLKIIECRIKKKEERLASLKRAELYARKHNVEELNALELKWKSGCCQALRDLLDLLNKREDVDMVGLLKKLNIPEDMIRYNSENDDFF